MRTIDKIKINQKLKASNSYLKDFALELYDISTSHYASDEHIQLDFNQVKDWFFHVALMAKYIEQTLHKMGNHGVSHRDVFTTINGASIHANKLLPLLIVTLSEEDKIKLYETHLSMVKGVALFRKRLFIFDGKKVSCHPEYLNEIANLSFKLADDTYLAFS